MCAYEMLRNRVSFEFFDVFLFLIIVIYYNSIKSNKLHVSKAHYISKKLLLASSRPLVDHQKSQICNRL